MKKTAAFLLIFFVIVTPSLSQEIHKAVQSGDLENVKIILEKDPELVKLKDNRGMIPIGIAVMMGHSDIVKLLIEKGSEFRYFDDDFSPLHMAAAYCRTDIARLLIEKGADIEYRGSDGKTPLHFAAYSGRKQIGELLVEKGANINSRDDSGYTPLYLAVINGHKEIVNALLEKGAAIETDGENGRILLHLAASGGLKKLVELMISEEVDTNTGNTHEGILLHSTAAGGLIKLVQSLIRKGAELNHKDIYGLTPLHYAASGGHKAVVELLVVKGADINSISNDGSTPLHLSKTLNDKDIIDLLISNGADTGPGKFPVLKGEYLGQKKPGLTPKIFAPGIVSKKDYFDMASTFSPDGKEFYFTRRQTGEAENRIYYMKLKNGVWTEPQLAPFSYDCFEFEPIISPDGQKLFYGSKRPLPGKPELNRQSDIWVVDKTESGWSEPHHHGPGMMYISVTNDGSLYFTGEGYSILKSRYVNGKYLEPEKVGNPENNIHPGAHSYIAPDESYIIFDSRGRPGGYGDNDLYISFRNEDETWSKARNMGDKINSKDSEMAANVSPDGRYLFFMSKRSGVPNIYWVNTKIIEELKDK